MYADHNIHGVQVGDKFVARGGHDGFVTAVLNDSIRLMFGGMSARWYWDSVDYVFTAPHWSYTPAACPAHIRLPPGA